MKRAITVALFYFLRVGKCPCCGQWSRFTDPEPLLTGPIPAEVEGLVPHISKCARNGCTSSVQTLTGLVAKTAAKEA